MHDNVQEHDNKSLWAAGYSIAELWGNGKPVTRGTSAVDGPHLLLWGILSIVEYQVNVGAGHKYLRERLRSGEWIAFGMKEPASDASEIVRIPPISEAQFGRKQSAVGDGVTTYVNVRIISSKLLDLPPLPAS